MLSYNISSLLHLIYIYMLGHFSIHILGLPQPPLKPTLMELTNNTLSLRVRSLFPGSESVIFTVTPLLITATSDTAKDEIRKDIPSYHSGVEVEVIIHDLNVGSTYRFRVNISNKFGNSTVLSDEIIVLGKISRNSYF